MTEENNEKKYMNIDELSQNTAGQVAIVAARWIAAVRLKVAVPSREL